MRRAFTITRDKWLNAGTRGDTDTMLFDPSRDRHNMCCLGQIMHQCGVPLDMLQHQLRPADSGVGPLLAQYDVGFLLYGDGLECTDNQLASRAMDINDDNDTPRTPEVREADLAALFADEGIRLTFVE